MIIQQHFPKPRTYGLTPTAEVQSKLLFRMGASQQRLGRFADADRTFQLVEQRYPGSPAAQWARQREGQRNFYIQLATFNTPAGADRAMESLKSSGVVITKRADPAGHTLLDAGPFSTFEDAKVVQQRFAAEYPTALIVP